MNILACLMFHLVFLLSLDSKALATTAARSKAPLARVLTHQLIPRDTLRAGQDIELRKVQAMLSRQGPPKGKKNDPRR